MKILRKLIFVIICFLSLMVYAAYRQNSGVSITNEASPISQPPLFPHAPTSSPQIPQGIQVARSLLGLEVKFLNGTINYPGPFIVNDPRYQALAVNEKLVDAIQFHPLQGVPFLLLVAIAKNPNGGTAIVPGKFDIIHKTEQDGFVLKDAHGRLFYYSGYILMTPAWQNLIPGQILQDKFCKIAIPMAMCPLKDTVNVLLKKRPDPRKDIPLLAFVH